MAHKGSRVYNPQGVMERLAEEDRMAVVVCRCAGHCKCKPPTMKSQWPEQSEVGEFWKRMVAKVTTDGLVHLACCLSYG